MFPLHLLYLYATSKHSITTIRISILDALQKHLSPKPLLPSPSGPSFPAWRLFRLVLLLTAGVTFPALMWFVAVTMAP